MIIRVIDVETCGLPPDNNQVVEVATVDLVLRQRDDGPHWERGRMWSSLVNPGRDIPPEASGVHHITHDMVEAMPKIEDLHSMIIAAVDGAAPAHYAAHEAKFEKLALPALAPNIDICTRKTAVTLWPDAANHKNMTLRYFLGLKLADPSLAAPHRAGGDAYVTAAILRRMLGTKLTDGNAVTPEWLLDVSSKPVLLSKLHFGMHAMKPCELVPPDYWSWVVANIKDDEDVQYTAQTWQAHHRAAKRNRSPV